MTMELSPAWPSRDFTVAVFVVREGRVLLHHHRKLDRWLPPGGHIEPNELPDEAAVREVWEETGIRATLLPERGIEIDGPGQPRQLCRPAGIQLEDIASGHQHIDLIYFASAITPTAASVTATATATASVSESLPADVGWFGPAEWQALGLTEEVVAWCEAAIAAVERAVVAGQRAGR